MEAHKEDTLTPEEVQLVREMLEKAKQRERETATATKESFQKWFFAISVTDTLLSLAEKIKSISWEQVTNYFVNLFP